MATDKSVATVKPKAAPRAPSASGGGSGMVQRSRKYLNEVWIELKKTIWPTRQELLNETQVVLAVVIAIGIFISVWDSLLGLIFAGIFHMLGVRNLH